MLLNSVIIVLREVLEAALLLSVFLASARLLAIRNRWVVSASAVGIIGAAVYGYSLGPISEWFDGVGQEVCNALLQFGAFAFLAAVVFQMPRRISSSQTSPAKIVLLMAVTAALAIAREGAEVLIYQSGFWGVGNFTSAVAIGSVIGACIGFSVGVLIYYLLLAQPVRFALSTTLTLLTLIAAGMASQATRLLIQADWISSSGALWDTSAVLSERSLPGQLLYALIGYESSPSAPEVVAYLGAATVIVAMYFSGRFIARLSAAELQ